MMASSAETLGLIKREDSRDIDGSLEHGNTIINEKAEDIISKKQAEQKRRRMLNYNRERKIYARKVG